MTEQALSDEDRMFGIVADHAASENQPMPPATPVQALNAAAGQPFRWQPQRIANCGADQQAAQPQSQLGDRGFRTW